MAGRRLTQAASRALSEARASARAILRLGAVTRTMAQDGFMEWSRARVRAADKNDCGG